MSAITAASPESPSPRRFPRLARWLEVSAWLWLAALLGWALLRHLLAETVWWLHPILYFPPLLWFLPGLLLFPALLFQRSKNHRTALAALVVAALLHPPHLNSPIPPAPGLPTLSLVTLNAGKREDLPPRDFVARAAPDFILLQDARDHYLWDSRLPGYSMAALDEFMLLSKWPVVSRELIHCRDVFPSTVAARFVVRWRDRDIALYAIHLPSPRHLFRSALGRIPGKSPWGLLSSETREDYEKRLAKIHAAQAHVRLRLQQERLPALVAGDFNLPPHSLHLRQMADLGWTDAFAKRGSGWGNSFPGDQPFWAAFNRPWLRLDYVFHSKEWTALSCEVEPAGPGQHSAVWAVLQPTGAGVTIRPN